MTIEREAAERETELPETQENELEPVEVDIGADAAAEGEPAPKVEDDVGQRQPRQNNGARSRINKLTREKHEATTRAEILTQENERLKSDFQKVRQSAQVSDRAALIHYETAVKGELEGARRFSIEATASGDPEKIADANIALSRAAQKQQELDSWKANQPAAPAASAAPQPQPRAETRQQPEPVQLDPALKSWIDDNPWFAAANADDFDAEMHQEATAYATMLERKYMRQGKQDQIGTKPYFEEVNKHMRSEFPDYFGDEPAPQPTPGRRTPPMAAPRTGVVPAANTNGSARADGRSVNGTKVTLSAEERKFAHTMAANGALMVKGRKATPEEAEILYGKQILNSSKGA